MKPKSWADLAPYLFVCLGTAAPVLAQDPRLDSVTEFFSEAQVVAGPSVVDCKLSGSTETTCFSITVKSEPLSYTPGPWCPGNIADGAQAGGIWLQGGDVFDVDGAFIANLAEFYGDTNWQLFNPETGEINVTRTLEGCLAAARPDVDPEYQNYCVQCLPEYMPEDATLTYVIPLDPLPPTAENPTNVLHSGVAYNGVMLDGPAPVDAILGAYTLAPFDDCGGHVNPHAGYHYHAVIDCLDHAPGTLGGLSGNVASVHGSQIGIAMDGYQIFPHLMADGSDPVGLDVCNGHTTEDGTYHYHAGQSGSNAILGCLRAEAGCALNDQGATCDASAPRRRP